MIISVKASMDKNEYIQTANKSFEVWTSMDEKKFDNLVNEQAAEFANGLLIYSWLEMSKHKKAYQVCKDIVVMFTRDTVQKSMELDGLLFGIPQGAPDVQDCCKQVVEKVMTLVPPAQPNTPPMEGETIH